MILRLILHERRLPSHMAKYVKAIRQTLNEISYTSPLDECSFVMTWKANFDFRILLLSKFHSRPWWHQEAIPTPCCPTSPPNSGSDQHLKGPCKHTHEHCNLHIQSSSLSSIKSPSFIPSRLGCTHQEDRSM